LDQIHPRMIVEPAFSLFNPSGWGFLLYATTMSQLRFALEFYSLA
jgi:hypothetical protein